MTPSGLVRSTNGHLLIAPVGQVATEHLRQPICRTVNAVGRTILLALIASIVLQACARDAGAPPADPEVALRQRATTFGNAFLTGKYGDAYELLSPRFRVGCCSADFETQSGRALALPAAFLKFDPNAKLGFVITKVQVTGAEGLVFGNLTANGAVVGEGATAYGSRWVLVSGEWYAEPSWHR